MHPDGVRKSLLIDEMKPHAIVLASGDRIVVLSRELWIAGPEYLIVLDERGAQHHVDYRSIVEIRPAKNGRKRKKRA